MQSQKYKRKIGRQQEKKITGFFYSRNNNKLTNNKGDKND